MSIDNPGIATAMFAGRRRPRPVRPSASKWRPWACAVLTVAGIVLAAVALAESPAPAQAQTPATFQGLDAEVQALKQEVVDLNRDLFMLEEELLFPANTQVAVFVSMDVGTFFALDSVKIVVDGKDVANYLYTQREAEALLRGGVHRAWLGNLKPGKHEMTAFFTGKGTHDRDYKRGATLTIDKGVGAKYVELRISDRASQLQPEFVVKEWE